MEVRVKMVKSMEKALWRLCILSCAFVVSGCGKGELPNTYVEGCDFQYMRQGSADYVPEMQKGEDGYYFRRGEFIYYLDEKTDTLLPLCNRADCLHERETDGDRREACNAFVANEFERSNCRGIAYCNGYIYCLSIDSNAFHEKATLYRIAADGSSKEQAFRWDDIVVEDWIIHRDTLFFVERIHYFPSEHEEEESDEDIRDSFTIKKLKLTGSMEQPEAIYVLDEENVYYLGCNWFMAYGNYFYTIISGVIAMEDGSFDSYEKTFIYDMKKEVFYELTYDGMTQQEEILSVTFWQDRILFMPIIFDGRDLETSYRRTGNIYIADLDGSNAEIFMEDVSMGYATRSDGRYLYLTNGTMVTMSDWGYWDYSEKKTFWVYDEENELVDTFVLPEAVKDFGAPAIGDAERMYTIYQEDDGGWGVLRLDKSKIGSYHGAEIDFTVIPYE